MSIPDFPFVDMHGYDPYNHVGVQIRRHELFKKMQADMLRNKVLVMDTSQLDMLKELMPKPRFIGADFGAEPSRMVTHGLYGARVIHAPIFPTVDV